MKPLVVPLEMPLERVPPEHPCSVEEWRFEVDTVFGGDWDRFHAWMQQQAETLPNGGGARDHTLVCVRALATYLEK